MEKKTIDTLRVMLCGEIEDIAKQGTLSHETLDILKDLVETEKNLVKIEKYDEEKKEKEEMMKMGEMSMDGGYSQRKFYIDADYQPYGQTYIRGGQSYMDRNSYARGRDDNLRMRSNYSMYDDSSPYTDGGNSYMYYDPRYEQMPMYSMARGYSRTNNQQETIKELQELMNGTQDPKIKDAIQKTINEMNK